MPPNLDFQGAPAHAFWAELSPCEHLVQFYDADDAFVDTLERFIGGGLAADESTIVIGTPAHVRILDERLAASGIDVDAARDQDRYLVLDAEQTLGFFMKKGWPDEELFFALVRDLLRRARGEGRKIRAFGEMVAIMWARGDCAATVRLEHLWHQLCSSEDFKLLCAYPKVGFTQDTADSIKQICAAHSRVLPH